MNDLTGEGNIESMLSVEMGLRELASLKVLLSLTWVSLAYTHFNVVIFHVALFSYMNY